MRNLKESELTVVAYKELVESLKSEISNLKNQLTV
jgi:hypothetical protein